MSRKLEVLALVAGLALVGSSSQFIKNSLYHPKQESYSSEKEFDRAEEKYCWNDLMGRSLLTVGTLGTLYGGILFSQNRRKR